MASAISGAHNLCLSAARAREQKRPLILGYHRVVEDFASAARTENPSMLISRAMFERHVEWIARRFRIATLDEIGQHVANQVPFTEPVAAITFDDGYRDVYEHAYPMLRQKGLPAAVFVVTDLIGTSAWQIHDKLYHLVAKAFARWDHPRRQLTGVLTDLGLPAKEILRPRDSTRSSLLTISALLPALAQADVTRVMDYLEGSVGNGTREIPESLNWPMIDEMRRGGITIGSHTKSHVSLPVESAATVAEELDGSKRTLEQHFGEPVAHFAYPGGQFTPAVVDALARAGYQYGYTACPHGDPRHRPLTLERLLLWEGSSIDADGCFSSAVLDCQVNNLWPPARRCERAH